MTYLTFLDKGTPLITLRIDHETKTAEVTTLLSQNLSHSILPLQDQNYQGLTKRLQTYLDNQKSLKDNLDLLKTQGLLNPPLPHVTIELEEVDLAR